MKDLIFILVLTSLISSCSIEQRKNQNGLFVFEPDIRLFTTYAFMNAAGYDQDWNATLHPVRVEIRKYLDSILTDDYKNEIHKYYEKFGGGDFYGYGVYAINSKNPPDFGLKCDSCRNEDIARFETFDSLLQDFYNRAKIPVLWEKYYKRLYDINLRYKPFAEIIIGYCQTDSGYLRNHNRGKLYYQQIPLMSHFTAFFQKTGNDYWIISGPSIEYPDPNAFLFW